MTVSLLRGDVFGPIPGVRITSDGADGIRFTQALWYAVGRKDSGTTVPGDVFEFATLYATAYRYYDRGRTGYMVSMQRAFDNWCALRQIDTL